MRVDKHLLFVLGVALLAVSGTLVFGYPVGHSTSLNILWAQQFADQFWSGILYPRWLSNSIEGFGAPTFFYYPPLPFWWAALFQPLVPTELEAWETLRYATSAVALLAGVSCYYWLRNLTQSPNAAAFGACLYVFAPYQLSINFYMRTAYAEYFAAAVLPLVLLAAKRASEGSSKALLALAASYAALIFSHLPTTLMVSIFPAMMPLFFTEKKHLLKTFLRVWAAMILGAGLAAIYLIPALLSQHLIDADKLWSDFYQYRQWFLFSGITHFANGRAVPSIISITEQIILSSFIVLLLYGGLLFLRRKQHGTPIRSLAFAATLCLICGFMTTQASVFIWEIFYPLQKVQFPYRFLGAFEAGAVSLLALGYAVVEKTTPPRAQIKWFGVKIQWVLLVVLAGYVFSTRLEHVVGTKDARLASFVTLKARQGVEPPEYGTVYTDNAYTKEIIGFTGAAEQPFHYPLLHALPEKVRITEGNSTITVKSWNPPESIILDVASNEGATLQLHQFYFPIWSATLVSPQKEILPLSLRPSAHLGLLEFSLPPQSEGTVTISRVFMPIERWAQYTSLAALLLWGLGWICATRQRI
jgi:hypothetical protein